jgi:hypothetical protein
MRYRVALILLILASPLLLAQETDPNLTIYNQNFAVVRQPINLSLIEGVNHIRFTETTAHLEPDSVILRDPDGVWQLQILEQNYRADPVSQALLLSLYEGETIDFLVQYRDGSQTVTGKIIRSGYVPHQVGLSRYGTQYYNAQMSRAGAGGGQPIIEVDGKLRFNLPGLPLFPTLADDTILKPTLDWQIQSSRAGQLAAELGYVTGGMSWEANYNVVAPEKGDILDLVGWVTIDNQSGKAFPNSQIKLMAGDVNKLQPDGGVATGRMMAMEAKAMDAAVTEKAFDEYHLYSLNRRTTLHDRETKQVEFIHAEDIQSTRIYFYDGARVNPNRWRGYASHGLLQDANFGIQFNSKVAVMREFENSKENNLGIPMPRGRIRFYREDDDRQLEFTGENLIDHTPKDETIRLKTGDAFDLVGERIRADYRIDTRGHWVDESFEIKLRNHKEEPVVIKVLEHLYRWSNWELVTTSDEYNRLDSQTIEFNVTVEPDEEKVVTYKVHYSW